MLNAYGWSEALQRDFAPFAAQSLQPGRIVLQQRGGYGLITETGECTARLAGRLSHESAPGDLPVAGDWVAVDLSRGAGAAVIRHVLPRRTAFVRKQAGSEAPQTVAANVDLALLVSALDADFNLRRLERYLAAAFESGAEPVIVLTKADLAADAHEKAAEAGQIAAGVPVELVSVVTGQGVEALRSRLQPGLTAVLIGMSGVGKSSLVNALAGEEVMATGEVRADDARGRHTTTHRQIVRLPGGALILDTPGMREFGLWDAGEGVSAAFQDIEEIARRCRFRDCRHEREPGCAVRAALETGEISAERWRSYEKLQRELGYFDRKDDPIARQAYRRHWTQIAKANRQRYRARGASGEED